MLKLALLCGASALAAGLGLCGASAWAATATPASAAEASPAVGELVVVAEKREQKIESVPVAITAFSSQQRALEGIVIFQDLAQMTPGLTWTDVDDRVYIRGIGRNSDNLNNTSGVALYYNGIYYGANAAIELQRDDLFIASTEVDKGPQNTLHGSNADGGIVDFESQRPTNTYYAEGRVEVDNYSTFRTEFALSGPIDDHWKFRVGGNYSQQSGGFFNNLDGPPQGGDLVLGGGGQTHYLEGQLEGNWNHFDLWTLVSSGDFAANTHGGNTLGAYPLTPTNAFQSNLFYTGFYGLCGLPGVATNPANTFDGGCAANAPPVVPGSVKTLPFTANMFPGNNPANSNIHDFLNEFNEINDQQRDVQVTVHATWHAPGFDVSYLGGFQQFHYILRIPDQPQGLIDSGVTSYELAGAPNAGAAFLCNVVVGYSLASCEAPLKINSTPQYLIFNEYDLAFSHELNITSTWDSPFQYVAGAYWWKEHWNQPVNQWTTPDQPQFLSPMYLSGVGATCPGTEVLCAAPLNPSEAGSTENTAINYNSYAGFVQGSYKFSDQWKATAAVRYTEDHKAGWQEWRLLDMMIFNPGGTVCAAAGTCFGANTPAVDITGLVDGGLIGKAFPGAGPAILNATTGFVERTLDITNTAWTGEADVDWTPDKDTLAYAKISRGYKSGGWSTYTLGADPTVNPEFDTVYEAGVKRTFGSEFTLNADGYYYNYYGMQVPLTVVNSIGQLVPILYNIPLTHIYGTEIEAFWHPLESLTVSFGYSYLNARIAQSACVEDTTDPLAVQPGADTTGCYSSAAALAAARTAGAVAQSIRGQEIPAATPNHVNLNALYTIPFEPGKLTLSGTFIWNDQTYDAVFNRTYTFEPSYTQVNLRATWNSADDHYTVVAFVNNVFNTIALDANGGTLLGADTAKGADILTGPTLNAPRTFGLQFQYRWR